MTEKTRGGAEDQEVIKLRARGETLVATIVVCAYATRSFLVAYAPQANFDERLWLEWLGREILRTGRIPHALGPETLTAAGAHWTPQEWLFACALAFCAQRRLDFVVDAVMALVAVTPLLVVWARLRAEQTRPIALVLALLILSTALGTEFQVRASVVASAIAALVFAALQSGDRRCWSVPFLIALLANIHATALLLSIVPALFCAGARFDRRSVDRTKLAVAILSPAATLCTPFGIDLWRFALTLSTGGVHRYIAEWTPLYRALGSSPGSMLAMIALFLTVLVWIGSRQRSLSTGETALLVLTGALALYAERFAVLYIIACMLPAFRASSAPQEHAQRSLEAGRTIAAVAILVAVLEVSQILRMIVRDPVADVPDRPGLRIPVAWTAPQRIADPADERVFCTNFTFCNAYLSAGARVYVDGRADAFPLALWRETREIAELKPRWRERLRALDVNVVVTTTGRRLALALRKDRAWRLTDIDDDNDTFVRRDMHKRGKAG